jgi:hypothetical protein
VSELISNVEALVSIAEYDPTGILQGRSQFSERSLVPRVVRSWLDSKCGAAGTHGVGAAGAVLTLIGPRHRNVQTLGAFLIYVSRKAIEYRNPYGGDGADQMSDLIAAYRVSTAAIPDRVRGDDLFLRAVNAQVCVAYLASGVAKLISSSWRSGRALEEILQTELYGVSRLAGFLRAHRTISRALTWFTIAWECGFPVLYLLGPRAGRNMLHLIKAFHLGIAVTMGLPRFFWAFSSAHAAVAYVMDRRAGPR